MAYDIIGDIHGHADKLHALLRALGYRRRNHVYRHPNPRRQAIFVGDFIDSGPQQLRTLRTVRRMVDAGTAMATMGNHEFNAIAWHTRDPDKPEEFLRPHHGELGVKNAEQHSAFLREVGGNPALHREWVDWFLTLPLWLDLRDIRVVHACWHEEYMTALRGRLTANHCLTRELMTPASRSGTIEFRAVEGLIKGLETPLPAGFGFTDKYQNHRASVRIRWWDPDATTYREAAHLPEDQREALPDEPIAHDARSRVPLTKPVFFGHYWMSGDPALQSAQAACVDYSVARGGPLVAYRWDGEQQLDARNFLMV